MHVWSSGSAVLENGKPKTCNLFCNIAAKRVNSDVAPVTTHVPTCLSTNKVARFFFVGGKTRNVAIQLVLQQSRQTGCTFFVSCFTVSQVVHVVNITLFLLYRTLE